MTTQATPTSPSSRKKILDILGKVVKILLPIAISAGLVIWLLHNVNFEKIKDVIHQGIRLEWIFLMMFFTMLSFIIRGIRWGIQLRAAGVPRMSVTSESVSIFGAYALNLVVQFLGEAWRCLYVTRREKVKLATVVGTDLGDRGSDAVMIILILGLTLAVASDRIKMFFEKYPLGRFLENAFDKWYLYVGILLIIAVFILIDYKWRNTKFFSGFNKSFFRLWDGFKVLFFMKGRWEYVWLTFGIWICYFLETYSCFYAFPFTRELISMPGSAWGLIPGLVVFVFGSFSMAVPSEGGLGPWNIAVMYALVLYGVGRDEATAYSLVVWGFQAVMIIALGIFSAVYVMLTKNREVSTQISTQDTKNNVTQNDSAQHLQ